MRSIMNSSAASAILNRGSINKRNCAYAQISIRYSQIIRLDLLYECTLAQKIRYNIIQFKSLNESEGSLIKPKKQISKLAEGFSSSTKLLTAIGNETRQHLILEMMKMGKCSGVRVMEITEKTNLSRPAVSHHLQIMKDAGIVKVRKEGTMNFYYFDPEMEALERLINTLQLAKEISGALPDRTNENN